MGVNKVIFYGETLVDMSQVTVTPETLGKGETALNAKGDLITGTHECEETEPKLQSKTVSPSTSLQTVNPDSGYDGLSKVTVNAMPVATQATPSISVSSGGLITASATQTAGYVSAGTKSGTKQLTTQAAQTITPGTSNKTIASGRYLTGTQTIKGDSNLVAGNIKSGVSIFGVAGTYEGSGGGGSASVETCTVSVTNSSGSHIQTFYTAYDNGIYDKGYMYSSGMLTNVVCNAVILIEFASSNNPTVQVSGDVKLLSIDSAINSCWFILLISNGSSGGNVIISSSSGGGLGGQ